jgi:hypothetical protein
MSYKPLFPERYRQWLEHDLAKYRPAFYQRLPQNREISIWEYIEQNYLLQYDHMVLVAFAWGAEGL